MGKLWHCFAHMIPPLGSCLLSEGFLLVDGQVCRRGLSRQAFDLRRYLVDDLCFPLRLTSKRCSSKVIHISWHFTEDHLTLLPHLPFWNDANQRKMTSGTGFIPGFQPQGVQVLTELEGSEPSCSYWAQALTLQIWGFHSHGDTPIAGWFISWKILIKNGWVRGTPPHLWKPPIEIMSPGDRRSENLSHQQAHWGEIRGSISSGLSRMIFSVQAAPESPQEFSLENSSLWNLL